MTARAIFFFLLLLALACLGCSVRPLGTNDVALTYRAAASARGAGLVTKVRDRLSAAQVTADVTETADGVRVVVDADAAEGVDELLQWRGGLTVHALAGDAPTVDGPFDRIADRARTMKVPAGERVLVQRTGPSTAIARVVKEKPLVDLSDEVASVTSLDGRTLSVHLGAHGANLLADAMSDLHGVDVVVARDRSALRVAPLDGEPIVLAFGDDLAAFSRARTTRLLLATPTLPRLERITRAALPTDATLAVTSIVVPFLLSLAWLAFVRRFDRAHPEPWPLVAATFALGGLSVIPAALAEVGWTRVSEWTDPSLVTMGGRLVALPIALVVFAVVVGLSEEGAKFLGAWSLAFHRREFDEPVDGLVYGAASALGFAAVENVKYFAIGRFGAVLIVIRTFLSIPAHLFFGAIWGYALGRKLVVPKTKLLAWLALAALAHGAFDAFLSIEGTAFLALLLNLALASAFIVFLRRALRHGVVTKETAKVDPAKRFLVPVGSPIAFAAAVIAFHVLAALVFLGSTIASEQNARFDLPLFAAMTALVALLGVAAYAVSRTMPLDVVFDEHGVTFGGAARAWTTVRGVERTLGGVRVRSTAGDVWIGPAGGEVIEAVSRAILARRRL